MSEFFSLAFSFEQSIHSALQLRTNKIGGRHSRIEKRKKKKEKRKKKKELH
jgi:hypothetical protein